MYLGAQAIRDGVANGDILIKPYNRENVGPNSYDVHLDPIILRVWTNAEQDGIKYQDPRLGQRVTSHEIPESGLLIMPGELWLGSTIERAGSMKYIPVYDGRSTIGRWGVWSHISAGLGDVGFTGTWTLEITSVLPFLLLPGMKIGQVRFSQVTDCLTTYNHGHHYAEQRGATPARAGNI